MLKNTKTEEVFDFPEYDSGSSYTTILVLKENTKITEILNGISIGALENSASINRFKEFCEKNGIKNTKIIEYKGDSAEVLHEALKNKEIDAVYVDGFKPIQNGKTNPQGIAIDILKSISNELDIEIDFKSVSNYEDALELVKNKQVGIISIPDNYSFIKDYDLYMTTSYTSIPVLKVKNKINSNENNGILVLPKKYIDAYEDNNENIIYYDNIKQCIEAVNNGDADYTYSDIYSLQLYTNKRYYKNISTMYEGEMSNDIKLLRAINKAIKSIQSEEINSIVYENTIESKDNVTLQSFIYSNFKEVLVLLFFISSIIILLVFIIMRNKIVTKNKINKLLKEKSETDSLTGILNCGASEDAIVDCLDNKKEDLYSAFFIIDVDNFKGVNDNFGHKVGDDILKELADNLIKLFDENSIVGRRGGDEFIVFMNNISSENLSIIYNQSTKLCQVMDKDITINDITQHISVSIGIAVTKECINFTKIYQLADEQLYKVKENGRNGYEVNIVN